MSDHDKRAEAATNPPASHDGCAWGNTRLPADVRLDTLAVREGLPPSQWGENSEGLFLTSSITAAMPLEVAMQAPVPSSAARRRSIMLTVGLEKRE